jgi:hypothetical protein
MESIRDDQIGSIKRLCYELTGNDSLAREPKQVVGLLRILGLLKDQGLIGALSVYEMCVDEVESHSKRYPKLSLPIFPIRFSSMHQMIVTNLLRRLSSLLVGSLIFCF